MNATLTKFGWPATALKDYEHWCILLRPAQVTLGSLIVCAKGSETALGQMSSAAFKELQLCTHDTESALATTFHFDKINYLALMMVDPHVHFHVLPRYASPVHFLGRSFPDMAWPGPPDIKARVEMTEAEFSTLKATLLDAFGKLR